jgi:hypothetical protein
MISKNKIIIILMIILTIIIGVIIFLLMTTPHIESLQLINKSVAINHPFNTLWA